MNRAYIALGANLGDPTATVTAAFEALRGLPRSRRSARSSLYRSAPVGLRNQPDFINAVARVDTDLTPIALLDALFSIEARFGRRRDFRNSPRTLDLDLLLYDDRVWNDAFLTLPHPRMHERAFVLLPLLELDPDCEIPGLGRAERFLAGCTDQRIERLASANSAIG